MGEAGRRRLKIENGPCTCQSGKPARGCCFDGTHWHKAPARLGLRALPECSVVEKCYMKELGSCDGGISSEHLISLSIILLLKADGDFSISGLPWIPEGETKIIGPGSLTANCLCAKHNSSLSPLDTAALRLFSALRSCLGREARGLHFIVSGHDIERWLLKTLKALAASSNLSRDRERLSGAFSTDVEVLNMLDDPRHWPDGAGLYCVMSAGNVTENHNRFQLAPLTNPHGDLSGLVANIMGLDFILMLEPPIMSQSPALANAKFRPGQIVVTYPAATNWLTISWEDGSRGGNTETLSLKFLREVKGLLPAQDELSYGHAT
jgi:hypothetical protein